MMNERIFTSAIDSDVPIEQLSRDELVRAVRMLENVNRAQATTIGVQEDRITELEGRNRDLSAIVTRTEGELNEIRLLSNSQNRQAAERSTTSIPASSIGPVEAKSGPATSATPPPSQPSRRSATVRPVSSVGNIVPSRTRVTLPRVGRNAFSAIHSSTAPSMVVPPQDAMPTPSASPPVPFDRRLRRQYVCPVANDRRLTRQPAFYEPREDPAELERRAGVLPSDSEVERFQKLLDYESAAVRRAAAFAGKKRCRAEVAEDESVEDRDGDRAASRSNAPTPSPQASPSNPPTGTTSSDHAHGSSTPAAEDPKSSRGSKRRRLSPTDPKAGSSAGPRRGGRDSDAKRRKH